LFLFLFFFVEKTSRLLYPYMMSRSSIASKIGLERMTVLTLSVYRQLFSTPILVGLAVVLDRPRRLPARSEIPNILLCGALGVFLNQVLFALGVQWAGAVIASIMQLVVSPMTSALEVILRMARFSWVKAGGIALCIVGSLLMIGIHNVNAFESTRVFGVLVLFSQACCAAGYLILQKRLLEDMQPATATAAMYIPGTVLTVLAAVIILPFTAAQWTPGDGIGWICVGYAVLFQSVAAYVLNAWANSKSSPSTVAVFETINVRAVASFM
jgi:drug/metabolite transporter (DMT)-like permease